MSAILLLTFLTAAVECLEASTTILAVAASIS